MFRGELGRRREAMPMGVRNVLRLLPEDRGSAGPFCGSSPLEYTSDDASGTIIELLGWAGLPASHEVQAQRALRGRDASDVARTDPGEAALERQIDRVPHRRRRGRGLLKSAAGIVGGEVDRRVASQRIGDPVQQFDDRSGGIVAVGDQQVGDFQVSAEVVLEGAATGQYGRQAGAAEIGIEGFGKGLDVDVGRVDPGKEFGAGLGVDVAIGDQDGFQSGCPGQFGDVEHVLEKDRGLVVGEGDGPAGVALRQRDDLLRRNKRKRALELPAVARQFVVLAEAAGEVAAVGSDGEGLAAGQEPGQRLLLDRVDVHRRRFPIGVGDERALLVAPDPAGACAAGRNPARSRAERAGHPTPVQGGEIARGPFLGGCGFCWRLGVHG